MVPDWLQLGVLFAVCFALGAARLPQVPKRVQQGVAFVRGLAAAWIVRVVLTGSFGVTPQADLDIATSIGVAAAGVVFLTGTLLPFIQATPREQRQEGRALVAGLVLGLVTLFAGPHALVIVAGVLIAVVLLRNPWKNSGVLLPLVAGVPLLIFSAHQRPAALTVAIVLMGLTVLFEIARLTWPIWNRALMLRLRAILTPAEFNRPLGISNAVIGVALLIALLDAHSALIAGTIGLLLPSLLRVLESRLRTTLGIRGPVAIRQARLSALVLTVLLLLLLLLPGVPGERGEVGAAVLLAGILMLPNLPIDRYLLAQVAAAAALVVL
ncbi:MAG: hypothetical protein U0517_02755 [Candidatus Andersenbacteria bacterium]